MSTYQPAPGLQSLTWPQIETIDQYAADLCRQSTGRGDARLTIVFKNGKPRFIERSTSEELHPTRYP